MPTPPNCCISVALCPKRATCCFDTPRINPSIPKSCFRRASMAESEHKLRSVSAAQLNERVAIVTPIEGKLSYSCRGRRVSDAPRPAH